jgi:hypothetical protein
MAAVAKIVVSASGDVGDARHRASASAAAGQRGDLVTEVVADERERPVRESRGQRPSGRLIRSHGDPACVDAFEDDLVLTDV